MFGGAQAGGKMLLEANSCKFLPDLDAFARRPMSSAAVANASFSAVLNSAAAAVLAAGTLQDGKLRENEGNAVLACDQMFPQID
jgi:hypothetical protein